MKKIITFVLLAAMLVTLVVPSAFAVIGAVVTAENAEVIEGENVLSSKLTLKAAPEGLASASVIVFWKADAGVEEVTLDINADAIDPESDVGTIYSGSNKNVKNLLSAYGANTAAYSACIVDFYALSTLSAEDVLGTLNFVFEEAPAKDSQFDFSVALTYAANGDDEDLAFSESEVKANIKVVADPNLGLYEDFTIFVVPETTELVYGSGKTTLKVDVRFDANPGVGQQSLVFVYPDSWKIVADATGKIFPVTEYSCGTYNKPVAEGLSYLKDRLISFPETPTEGTSYTTGLWQCEGVTDSSTKNGVLVTYTFEIPAGMKVGDTADFKIIYDKEGDISVNLGNSVFQYFAPESIGATVTMTCPHTNTHESVTKNATCGEDGSKDIVCDACSTVVSTEPIPATGLHDYEDKVTEPTCDEPGSEYKECKVCHDKTSETPIPPKGHTPGTPTVVAPTCTADGYTIAYCSVCKKNYGDPYDKIDKLGHDYGSKVTAPTCTEDGYTTYTCKREGCGDTYTADKVDKLGHDYKTEVTAPTCTEDGYTTYTCKREGCGDTYASDTVSKLGHNMQLDAGSSYAATCTEDGLNVYKCTREGCKETSDETITKLGHAWDGGSVTDPTCTAQGYTTYTCTREGCSQTKVENYVDALGHVYSVKMDAECVAPTCTENGYNVFKCVRCEDRQQITVDALGHDFDEGTEVVPATCTEKGTANFKCTREGCDYNEDRDIEALGHDWDEGTVTKEATETAKGEKVYKCQREGCEETKTEEIPVVVPEKKNDNGKTEGNKDNGNTNTNTNTNSKTGDNMMYIIIALAVVVLTSAAVIVIRRKKENN